MAIVAETDLQTDVVHRTRPRMVLQMSRQISEF
jgi:hypothetical protein